MDLFLQFGHGMMSMSRELIQSWEGGTVILSPRDLTYEQMQKFSSDLNSFGGNIVVDPQFYVPHSSHGKLTEHDFWPDDYETAWLSSNKVSEMLTVLRDSYNREFNSSVFLLPCIRSSEINQDWINIHEIIVNEGIKLISEQEIYISICLSREVMRSEEQIHLVLENLENWNVAGCYIVPEPPENTYLVEDPVWLINLIDLVAGIKLQGKKAIVGYCSHQMLCMALAKADAIATGNWLNVRSFNTARFDVSDGGISRRSKWYYCPQALSEYQIPFLDIAQRLGVLEELVAPREFESDYAQSLFSGAQPTSTGYGEGDSFRHYLTSVRAQTRQAVKTTYTATKESLRLQLQTANELGVFLNDNGVRGKNRDFSSVVDVNIAAIDAIHQLRGLALNQFWDKI